MIPVFLEPHAEAVTDLGEVDDTPQRIELRGRADEVDPIVMPMEVSAFAFVASSREGDSVPVANL